MFVTIIKYKSQDLIRATCVYKMKPIPHSEAIISSVLLLLFLKMCLNETCSRVRVGKHLSDTFLLRKVKNKEMLYPLSFSTLLSNMPLRGFKQIRRV
jgi:hypothetical protein